MPQVTLNALTNDDSIGTVNQTTWAAAHDAATGTVGQNSGDTSANFLGTGPNNYHAIRFFSRFDTSVLGVGALISAIDLKIYVTNKADPYGDGVDIVASTATDGALQSSDFQNLGTTVFATKALSAITTGQYNIWSLNASGIANINKTGNSKFATRITRDTTNTAPPSTDINGNLITQQKSGDANPPQLVITYTTGGSLLDLL